MKWMAVNSPPRRVGWRGLVLGLVVGAVGAVLLMLFVGAPLAVGHRQNSFLERFYGGFAVQVAAWAQGGSTANPVANDRRALVVGRNAFTGSCAQCHGLTGDGKGEFGRATFPPATDLRSDDTQEKSDAQLFWIVKNGLSFTGMREYSVSKLANVLHARELARRLQGGGVTTYSLHPGTIASDIWRRVPWPLRPLMKRRMRTPEQGAQTTIYCATSDEVTGQTGRYYVDCGPKEPAASVTDTLAAELWRRSGEWTGVGE